MTGSGRRWGAQVLAGGGVRFRLWAPGHERICVRIDGCTDLLQLTRGPAGWHELDTLQASNHGRYRFVLADGSELADPASLCQPHGIDGPSEILDLTSFPWQHRQWPGRPWHEAVIYELHVGTFTPEGTFRAVIGRLPHLAGLGVTAIELMPVAAFAGDRNWGYDGVLPYAPAAAYGRPEDLQALIDAAHGLGIMVILDVVYNHFGPQGNVMHTLAPEFFTEQHQTPWGAGFNFESAPPVRQFFIDNALHWLQCYRADGLRLDAVHAIQDDSEEHIIDAIARVVTERVSGRHVHLILENENNEAHRLERDNGKPVLFTAQWNDDVHHALHAAVTSEGSGYYADYLGDARKLSRSLAEGFAFQGETMRYSGRSRGEPCSHLPPLAFVSFLQNHDQIGNRAFGERLTALAPQAAVRAAAAVYLLLPQIPMLFMGEEWAATQPFPFFCDFGGELRQAVVRGRREEFARFPEFSDPVRRARIPDPGSAATFAAARLDWSEAQQPAGRQQLQWYQQLLRIRHGQIIPRLPGIQHGGRPVPAGKLLQVQWTLQDGGCLQLVANLAPHPVAAGLGALEHLIWREGIRTPSQFGPWSVEWSVGPAAA